MILTCLPGPEVIGCHLNDPSPQANSSSVDPAMLGTHPAPDGSPIGPTCAWAETPERQLGQLPLQARRAVTGSQGPAARPHYEEDEMNPWISQCIAAEHTKDLRRQAATKRLARQAGTASPSAVPAAAAVHRHRQDREPEARITREPCQLTAPGTPSWQRPRTASQSPPRPILRRQLLSRRLRLPFLLVTSSSVVVITAPLPPSIRLGAIGPETPL
jgi:hypothetical protein